MFSLSILQYRARILAVIPQADTLQQLMRTLSQINCGKVLYLRSTSRNLALWRAKGEVLCQSAVPALHTQPEKMAYRGKRRHLVLRSLLLTLLKSSKLQAAHASLSALERH